MKLRINPLAVDDLKQIKAYISEELQNPDSALKIVTGIIERYSRLTEFPQMGPLLSSIIDIETNFRYLICDTYIVFYTINKEYVSIYRVLSSRQDYIRALFK
ncbi:type II toxin-antitoxin system RelE/ParE family toxin [Geovibrio sp. ADMFC3]